MNCDSHCSQLCVRCTRYRSPPGIHFRYKNRSFCLTSQSLLTFSLARSNSHLSLLIEKFLLDWGEFTSVTIRMVVLSQSLCYEHVEVIENGLRMMINNILVHKKVGDRMAACSGECCFTISLFQILTHKMNIAELVRSFKSTSGRSSPSCSGTSRSERLLNRRFSKQEACLVNINRRFDCER